MPRHGAPLLASALLVAACTSVHDDLSRQLLQPPDIALVAPADLGLQAEPFELEVGSDATLSGWWIPNAAAQGRTVVLLHEETVNGSAVHPYYTFLHGAGFHVLVVDPRGYGKSRGTPSLRAWLYDLDAVFDWLDERPEVDRDKIALFGTSLGSVGAMWAVRTHPHCRAAVFEHLPSPRAMLREAMAGDGSAFSEYSIGVVEFGLPENLEPLDNAPECRATALFVTGELENGRDRRALLAAYDAYAGDKQLWVLPGTGRAPHALLTHDGDYQRRITDFLAATFAGTRDGLVATATKVRDASDGEAWYEIAIAPAGTAPGTSAAVEACAVLPDGSPRFCAPTLLAAAGGNVRIKLPAAPTWTSATRRHAFDIAADDGQTATLVPAATHLTRSGAAIAPLWPRIEELRHGTAAPETCRTLAADLLAAAAPEPFHAALETELADVFALLGLAFADSGRTAEARGWLERALAAVPAEPRRHFWPGPVPTYGFPQAPAVDRARARLAALPR
jgi:fermentation-respiration switch protein FrsA (DUF1100 family)